MTRFDFTPYRRSTVGFDRLFDLLENQARLNAGDNYPPFNISRRGEDNYRITLAVAGFRAPDIDITAQQNLLVVQGRKRDDGEDGAELIHVGIANRGFERRFEMVGGKRPPDLPIMAVARDDMRVEAAPEQSNLILGRLDPVTFLGGEFALDLDGARALFDALAEGG